MIEKRKEESYLELTGQIEEIIYQNEVNSYMIAILGTEEEEITIVGYMPFINIGDTVKVIGNFVTHKEYGEQFKVNTFEKLMPQTLDSLEKYLAAGNIKGIGPVTAQKIVETFKEETINVFKFEPYKLAQIKGISNEKAIEMSQSFIENWEVWQIVGFLEKYGISAQNAKTVYEKLGTSTIEEIEANPYLLIDMVRGVDFTKIDKIARESGFDLRNDKRIKSGIRYSLLKISYNGHCCTLKENLIRFVSELLQVGEEEIEDSLIDLNVQEKIQIETRTNGEKWIYLDEFYRAEKNIARKITILKEAKNIKRISHFKKELEKIEKQSKIEFSEKQREAIEAINENNVTIITGGPGTGKTTIIKTVMDIYKDHGKKVVLCAPTGRAAKRMTETTGEEAKTLHRLLEIGKLEEEGNIENIEYDVAPIDADIIIVDEMSMVDMFLMNYLLKGIFQGTKLVLVGDADQLPSVGPGSILKDLIESEEIVTIHLNKIFRQAAKSKIIVNAHRVNEGKNLISKEELEEQEEMKQDFFYVKERNQEQILKQVISLCKERLKNFGNYDFFYNIQVLTPTKKGMLGTRELNKILQEELNPSSQEKKEKKSGEIIFREGDRVMQTKNNYDIFWQKVENSKENGTGIFNGELGRIQKIYEVEKQIKILFDDGKEAWYTYSELDQIEHAYAITIHKAQGSEFDVVIVVMPQTSPMLLTRNLLYTSMTRAKEMLIMIGDDQVMGYMIKNADNRKRNTGLAYKMMNA